VGKSLAEIIMNPVRQRIVQYLMLHDSGTVREMEKELSDIPRPSLYRHVNILLDAGCIRVIAEQGIRGAVERRFALVEQPMGESPSMAEVDQLIQGTLMSIASDFSRYFAGGDVDPQRDMLSVSASTLMLSDVEMLEFLQRIGSVINDYVQNGPGEGRKARRMCLISSPTEFKEGTGKC